MRGAEGSTIAGRYAIEARLGAGGLGVAYRARVERLARDVALKLLPSHEQVEVAVHANEHRAPRRRSRAPRPLRAYPSTARAYSSSTLTSASIDASFTTSPGPYSAGRQASPSRRHTSTSGSRCDTSTYSSRLASLR